MFRKCPPQAGPAEPVKDLRDVEFLTDTMVATMCSTATCDELQRVLAMRDSSGGNESFANGKHIFSDENEPKSMLAIDVRLKKEMIVVHCSKEACDLAKEAGGTDLDHWNCTGCDGQPPNANGKESSCSCFDYNVTKSCELWGTSNHLKLRVQSVDVNGTPEQEPLMLQNRGLRDMCAML